MTERIAIREISTNSFYHHEGIEDSSLWIETDSRHWPSHWVLRANQFVKETTFKVCRTWIWKFKSNNRVCRKITSVTTRSLPSLTECILKELFQRHSRHYCFDSSQRCNDSLIRHSTYSFKEWYYLSSSFYLSSRKKRVSYESSRSSLEAKRQLRRLFKVRKIMYSSMKTVAQ